MAADGDWIQLWGPQIEVDVHQTLLHRGLDNSLPAIPSHQRFCDSRFSSEEATAAQTVQIKIFPGVTSYFAAFSERSKVPARQHAGSPCPWKGTALLRDVTATKRRFTFEVVLTLYHSYKSLNQTSKRRFNSTSGVLIIPHNREPPAGTAAATTPQLTLL